MKVLYLINKKEYDYHKTIIGDFLSVIPGDVFDMSDGTPAGDRYYEIEKCNPDVVITLDLAGFELRTGSDNLSLNNIYARMAHILLHKTDFYGKTLKARQNLSMFTYIPETEDTAGLRDRFPEVPNISGFVKFSRKPYDDNEHAENRNGIGIWWESFRKEAMI